MIGMPKIGSLNVVLPSFQVVSEYLTVKGSVANAKIVIENGTGELGQTRTVVQNQKLVIVLGLIHSSKKRF